jgi:hypothetical protein
MTDERDFDEPTLTIVGGQPPRQLVGGSIGKRAKFVRKISVPVGLEKVLYLAARSRALRERLLADRLGTIAGLGVELRESEQAMLAAAPEAALEAMIDRIDASNPRRRKFMSLVAAAATSLAAGTAAMGCLPQEATIAGGANDADVDSGADAGADAGQDAAVVDTDTYAGGGALTDLSSEDLEKK